MKAEFISTRIILLAVLASLISLLNLNVQSSSGELINSSSLLPYNQSTGTTFPTINGTYRNSILGFKIDLPQGWKGIDLHNMAMVSPTGIDTKTGGLLPGGDKVLMVLAGRNFSDFFKNLRDFKLSTFVNYLKSANVAMNCQIVSDKVVNFTGTKSVELVQHCGLLGKVRILSYIFASHDKLIFVSLKGTGVIFNHNLEVFKDSVQTIKIERFQSSAMISKTNK